MKSILKSVICSGFFLLALSMFSAEEGLKFIPQNSSSVIFLDFGSLVELPFCKELQKADSNLGETCDSFESTLNKKGLKLKDLFKSVTVFTLEDESAAAIIKTGVNEETFEKMFGAGEFKTVTSSSDIIKGKKVFVISPDKKTGKMPEDDEIATTFLYLNQDTMLVTDKTEIQKFSDICAKLNKNIESDGKFVALRKKVSKDAIAWAVFSNINKGQDAASNDEEPDMSSQIKSGCISVNFSGQKKMDLNFEGNFECVSQQASSTMAMQFQGLIGFMCGQFFSTDMALSQDVKNAIKITPKDKDLIINIQLPKALQDKLNNFDFTGFKGGDPAAAQQGTSPASASETAPVQNKKTQPSPATSEQKTKTVKK